MNIIDDKGVRRFPANSLYRHLVNIKQVDLNRLCLDYQKGKFTKEEYMDFYRGIGYSVCGFAEIFGDDVDIENPVWGKDK